MVGAEIEKGAPESELSGTDKSALQLKAHGTTTEKQSKKDAQGPEDTSTHKYVSFPPFPGETCGVALEVSQGEQLSVEAGAHEQESPNPPNQRPRKASSFWSWR
ncbi:hypothetical protein CORC01_11587 [Colletotrichum orchidophilum]|uniref:Uncharacterized protein n=1 Tax=Colletotrichum orchidophilum TaxID=1209926 RepID=A0A1G4AVB2_9PEZI|nr:uncharacterized protein CORC01_11587 [Colletotrichum orchidophilum]OHE93098.1 hypothetical protein CORC01_11587 [Colletotrichum orchidophilum]